MSLTDTVREAFSPDGVLSCTVDQFVPRTGQIEMAVAIAQTMEDGGVLVVEAGTGIGKTFAYLLPALLCGSRVLLSTATKTLQDQLFGRDLPHLTKALGLPLRIALLKGRGSYLCLNRLELARQSVHGIEATSKQLLTDVLRWSRQTRSGDLAELPGLDERSPMIAAITSTRENCLGSSCPQAGRCHVNLARREAMDADVVVINHHLFFADMAVRQSGLAEILPTVQTVIFDEAHQLNETGVQFLGRQLTTGQLLDFARDAQSSGLLHARGLADWLGLAHDVECATRDMCVVVGRVTPESRLRWVGAAPDQIDEIAWVNTLDAVQSACARAARALNMVSEMAPELMRLGERASDLSGRIELFSEPCESGSVRWVEVGAHLRLVESPLDIAQAFRQVRQTMSDEGGRRSWIFTSATLGNDDSLKWFIEPSGLQGARILKIDSPFDYARQASVYVPSNLSKPSDATHSVDVASLVARLATSIGGRTLVLTTSLRALNAVSMVLRQHFADSKRLEILVQGRGTKRELIDRFRRGDLAGGPGCILVASASFWEGVDVPGTALQMVVIDKLPFPPPGDPLVEARSKRLEAQGRSVFNDYFMPEAAVALKQGAGRLIRHESDRGVLVVCDKRLLVMGYGRRLLAALPSMRKINSEEELIVTLQALTRTSTTDSACL